VLPTSNAHEKPNDDSDNPIQEANHHEDHTLARITLDRRQKPARMARQEHRLRATPDQLVHRPAHLHYLAYPGLHLPCRIADFVERHVLSECGAEILERIQREIANIERGDRLTREARRRHNG
jgi:hypothetical protein